MKEYVGKFLTRSQSYTQEQSSTRPQLKSGTIYSGYIFNASLYPQIMIYLKSIRKGGLSFIAPAHIIADNKASGASREIGANMLNIAVESI